MKYAHLLDAFYCQPWYLRGDYWRNFDAILQRAMVGQEVSPVMPRPRQIFPTDAGRPVVGPVDDNGDPFVPQMQVMGPLAIIPVHGVLGRHLSILDLWCGGCDYAYVAEFIDMAAGDDSIETVLFAFNSPGGSAAGCPECAAAIAGLDEVKLTIAFVDGMACSAAAWLASQCRETWATPASQVGNIGTILAGVDSSANWAQNGLKLELFTSSPLKATGAAGKPWTDEDRAYLQERMLQMDAGIKNGVKAGRPGLDPTALDGRFFYADIPPGAPGQSGLSVGLVDAVCANLEEAITSLLTAR